MSDPELAALAAETAQQLIGPLWLGEIRAACVEVTRRFDPTVYGMAGCCDTRCGGRSSAGGGSPSWIGC